MALNFSIKTNSVRAQSSLLPRRRAMLKLGCALFSLAGGVAAVAAPATVQPDPAMVATVAPAWKPLPTPPKNAPNIILILTDDVGFGASSTFGGPVPTPNLDRLAKRGLTFNNFHTTGMCSPTRAALLTGRNHHAVGFGMIADTNSSFPGYTSQLPDDARTVAEVLHRSGYSTSMFGKGHLTPGWQRALTGPHTQWPTDIGFDYFFGFLAADSDQWRPNLIRNTTLVDNGDQPVSLLDKTLADDAIHWIHQAKADYPDKPFFTYYATGSTHAPHQAPAEWIARFRGRFDGGWDKLRAATVTRQKQAGIIKGNAKVSPRPDGLPAWADLTKQQQQMYARYMEVYAAQLSYQDAQIGRLFSELERMGELDNTLIVFMEGDNGASAEGGLEGTTNEVRHMSKDEARFSPAEIADLDRLGGPHSYENYPVGWAWAMNAPFPLFKTYASHLGGTRNGMVISWPKGISSPGRTISRFEHVIDIAPTVLEAAGIKAPDIIDGVKQRPLQGLSLSDTFTSVQPAPEHRTQYFELLGNRALYQDGWWANTAPTRLLWQEIASLNADDYKWQLYDLNTDSAQATNVAARYPERLKAMKDEWYRQAKANNVLPSRIFAPPNERRPKISRDEFVFWGTDVHLPWTHQPDLQTGNFTIEASFSIDSPEHAAGVLMATGSIMGGWSLKLENAIPVLYHDATEAAADVFRIAGDMPVSVGDHELVVIFLADSKKTGSGGTFTMSLDGKQIANQHIDRRAIRPLEINEMFDIGMDTGVSVIAGAEGWQKFNGRIEKLVVKQHQIPNTGH
ncbi:arylsulfatase [Sphingomonas sp. 28-63-12]|uniref:arylsulfatase n=1 Tax=Sphingomonas sp. 28-63-12 TaxID=1970434 RepID=UPI0035A97246